MLEAIPRAANGGLVHGFEDFDLERVPRDGRADKQMDPVDHWWLDA
ncbi:MAG TPA: hypothetical protein PLM24_05545 [Methanothrix sp.]|nr:hypothetical protein [Methanothrix sp.]HPJ83277.1 hypothetical protein [Methanothrix sp.]HPR66584.1 hypothetical protein [Methanothrix sp.]